MILRAGSDKLRYLSQLVEAASLPRLIFFVAFQQGEEAPFWSDPRQRRSLAAAAALVVDLWSQTPAAIRGSFAAIVSRAASDWNHPWHKFLLGVRIQT